MHHGLHHRQTTRRRTYHRDPAPVLGPHSCPTPQIRHRRRPRYSGTAGAQAGPLYQLRKLHDSHDADPAPSWPVSGARGPKPRVQLHGHPRVRIARTSGPPSPRGFGHRHWWKSPGHRARVGGAQRRTEALVLGPGPRVVHRSTWRLIRRGSGQARGRMMGESHAGGGGGGGRTIPARRL